MTRETPPSVSAAGHRAAPAVPPREFAMQFSATPRGARLARRLAGQRLAEWRLPYAAPVRDAVASIVGELAANAVRHGRVPGRDFQLRLAADRSVIRLEVSDCRAEQRPAAVPRVAAPDDESGRGLLLVAALATRWGVADRIGGPGKTVWAELDVR